MATINAVNTSLSGQSGTGNFAGNTSPVLTTPRMASIYSATNISEVLGIVGVASAANFINATNSIAGQSPAFQAAGSDTDVSLIVGSKGTGNVAIYGALNSAASPFGVANGTSYQHMTSFIFANTAVTRSVTFPDATGTLLMTGVAISTVPSIAFSSTSGVIGTTTNDNAAAGSVGEYIESVVTTQAITSNAVTNVTSISLTAGDWDVFGNVFTNPAISTTQAAIQVGINTTSVTFPSGQYATIVTPMSAGFNAGLSAPTRRLSLSGTTTVYLVAVSSYAISTLTINGTIGARRRR